LPKKYFSGILFRWGGKCQLAPRLLQNLSNHEVSYKKIQQTLITDSTLNALSTGRGLIEQAGEKGHFRHLECIDTLSVKLILETDRIIIYTTRRIICTHLANDRRANFGNRFDGRWQLSFPQSRSSRGSFTNAAVKELLTKRRFIFAEVIAEMKVVPSRGPS